MSDFSTLVTDSATTTFEQIARRAYGDEGLAYYVANANPGVFEPISPGLTLRIPKHRYTSVNRATGEQTFSPSVTRSKAETVNKGSDVRILVNGKTIATWLTVNLDTSLTQVASLNFTIFYDESQIIQLDILQPFSYQPVEMYVNDVRVFVGTVVSIQPSVSADGVTFAFAAYATCGVLNDCTLPISAYPSEYAEIGLFTLCRKLCEPFGISVSVYGWEDPEPIVLEASLRPGSTVLGFIKQLCEQHGVNVTSTYDGQLLLFRPNPQGAPVFRFREGEPPLLTIETTYNGQQYYSDLTAIETIEAGFGGEPYTDINPFARTVLRPFVFETKETDDAGAKVYAEQKSSQMFGESIRYTIGVSQWFDISGTMWRLQQTVQLKSPSALIRSDYEFMIAGVSFTKDANSETASLTLVLPEAYSNRKPKILPWQ